MPQEERPVATRNVVVHGANGLHMRPAEIVARAAARYEAKVTLTRHDLQVDAKSIIDLITLAAEQGAELVLKAEGPDADAAAEAIAKLFETDFDTEPSPKGEPPQA